MSDFLHEETGFSFDAVGTVLLAYGIANIAGNMLGGRVFGQCRRLFTRIGPAVMLALYALLYVFAGDRTVAALLVALLGVSAGAINISGQYMISAAAREAPDFSNGLFLTAANFGTAAGTFLCGLFIDFVDSRAALFATGLLLIAAVVLSYARTIKGDADYVPVTRATPA